MTEAVETIPMLDPRQHGQLELFYRKRIEPVANKLLEGGASQGPLIKQIDAEIGHYARKYSRSVNPSDHALGDAFYILQSKWRDSMQASGVTSTGRNALELLQGANEAYRKLLPLKIASERTASGMFTPQGVNAAAKGAPSELTTAARRVLPSTVPDTGTAGRTLLGAAILGGSAIDPITTLGTAGATAALTSRPAMRAMTKGAAQLSGKSLYDALPAAVQRQLDAMPPGEAQRALALIGARLAEQQGR